MKGIRNKKKSISWKLSYAYPVYFIEKENSESLFSHLAYAHVPAGDLRQAQ
jgi:hypothetical protein